jgi:DinB family protein
MARILRAAVPPILGPVTTTPTVDRPLLELTDPGLARPLPGALIRARADVLAAASDLLAIPEAALGMPWPWKGDSEEEVRYGAYRAAEALELAELEARTLMAPGDPRETEAARRVGPATAARWDLGGVLLPLDDGVLDADPGNGEWPVRLVLGHAIASQRGYAWGSSWWQSQGYRFDDPALPRSIPDEVFDGFPDEDGPEAEGTIGDLRTRLDAILDLSAERLAGLPDDRSAVAARWSGFAVTVAFRFLRWSSHLREHTIQVEKTLAMIGHEPGEPARLVRNVLAAYGRAESTVFGRDGAEVAAERVAVGAREARDAVASARASAEA